MLWVKDRLASANGNSIYYNTVNPLLPKTYKDMSFTYEGTRLTGITINYDNETTIYYDYYYYNHQGLRVKKVETYEYTDDRDSDETTTLYFYDGNKLITKYRSETDRIDFLYDVNGMLYGFINNKTDKYYYVRDVLQNILCIVDNAGNLIVKYDYNVYGELENITGSNTQLALRNPFRWKGYYHDSETDWFYCQSRYYVPEWCRWLTPDKVDYLESDNINGVNLYCYCRNNLVMYVDPSGHIAISLGVLMLIGAVVGAIVGAGTSAVMQAASNNLDWSKVDIRLVIVDGVFGAIDGALSVTGIGGVLGMVAGGSLSGMQYIVSQAVTGEKFNINEFLLSSSLGAIFSFHLVVMMDQTQLVFGRQQVTTWID